MKSFDGIACKRHVETGFRWRCSACCRMRQQAIAGGWGRLKSWSGIVRGREFRRIDEVATGSRHYFHKVGAYFQSVGWMGCMNNLLQNEIDAHIESQRWDKTIFDHKRRNER